MVTYVVEVKYVRDLLRDPKTPYVEYSGVEHRRLRDAVKELAIAKTDSSVEMYCIHEREART